VAYDYAQGRRWYQKAADRGAAVAEKVLSDPSSINQDQPMILRSQEQ
jgi:TPR repeat protein